MESQRYYTGDERGAKELCERFSAELVPVSMGGRATTDNGNDPTCLRGVSYDPPSKHLGEFCELTLFKGVTAEEVSNVQIMC